MQRHLPGLGDSISDNAFELGGQWQQGTKHFADRGKIVVGDPSAEAKQYFVENRSAIDHTLDILCSDRRLTVVDFHNHTSHALLTKGN